MAVERIRQNVRLWKHVCSLDPETLLRPSETDVATAQDAAAALKRMVDNRETGHEQVHVEAFVEDLGSAVQQLKVVSWDAIRRDRFSLTPDALFDEVSRSAAALLSQLDDESTRRKTYLEKGPEEADAPDLSLPRAFRKDKYDCDLDRFNREGADGDG